MAAVASNGVIGRDGDLPWRLPGDMRLFRHATMGKVVLMGRRSFATLNAPLRGRQVVVLSRTMERQESVEVVRTTEEACAYMEGKDAVVAGGAEVYAAFMKNVDALWLTHVQRAYEGDTVFPPVAWSEWQQVVHEEHPNDPRDEAGWIFAAYRRRGQA